MILFVLVLGFATVLVFSQSSPIQGHPAEEITPGTFSGGGDYIFPAGSKVGIGTASPQELLHVQGTFDTTHTPPWWFGDIALFEIDDFIIRDSSPNLRLETTDWHGGPNLNFGLISPSDNKLHIYSDSGASYTDRLVIDGTNGNVGIGTNKPKAGFKLDVEGKVQAQAFDTGDITFRDQETQKILWRMFEDENGLYLENPKTGKIYRFVLEEIG